MSRHVAALEQSRPVSQRCLGTDPDRRRSWAVRRRLSRKWEIETLEDRVVPATITVANLGDTGTLTLRAAIEQANLDSAQDTITFGPSVTGTISLSTALPDLSTNMVVAGPGASLLTVARSSVAGTPDFGIFTVPAGVQVTVSGLTITGGDDGGINNAGTLTVTHSTINGNSASGSDTSGDGGSGGAITNSGTLSVNDSNLNGNSAAGGTGGLLGYFGGGGSGGAITNSGSLSITDSTFNGNSAGGGDGGRIGDGGSGGAVANSGALSITDSTFSANSAGGGHGGFSGGGGSGGAITNSGTLSITDSTFSGNSAGGGTAYINIGGGGGGGGSGGAIANSGAVSVNDSTFNGNAAGGGSGGFSGGGGSGGAITNSGTLSITDSTFSGNSAGEGTGDGGGASLGSGGGIVISGTGNPKGTAINSIFWNTQGGNVSVAGRAFLSLGHNLFSDTPAALLDPTDLINTDPLLGPLADNGGPTLTQALLPGSPAINAGVAVPGVTTDQRGIHRPQGIAPDIGAFELQPPPVIVQAQRRGVHLHPTTLVVTFTHTMDAFSVANLADYQLVSAGPDHRFGTPDDRVIRIRSVRYYANFYTVRIRPAHRLPLRQRFQLTILGAPPAGLKDTAGLFLDGAGTGQQGSNYVIRITDKLLAPPFIHKAAKHAPVDHEDGNR